MMHENGNDWPMFEIPLATTVDARDELSAVLEPESGETIAEPLVDRSGSLNYNLHGSSGDQSITSAAAFGRRDRRFQGHYRSTAVFVEQVEVEAPATIDSTGLGIRAHGRIVRVSHGIGLAADKAPASLSFKITTAEVWTKPSPGSPRDFLFITGLHKIFPPQKDEDPKGSLLLRVMNITTGQHIGQRSLAGAHVIDLTSDTVVARKGEQLRIELIHQCHHTDETLNSTEADWALAGANFAYGILHEVMS